MTRYRSAILAGYLCAALAVTWLATDLTTQLRTPTGFARSLDIGQEFETPVTPPTSSDIDLAFIGKSPVIPKRFFSVRWNGEWYFSDEQRVDLYAGGDDTVTVRIDGNVVLARNINTGMQTASTRLTLGPGWHQLQVVFEQYAGDYQINVQWAPAGGVPRAFAATTVFPVRVSSRQLDMNARLDALDTLVIAIWMFPPAGLLLWVGIPPLLRIGRRGGQSWRTRSLTQWRQSLNPTAFPTTTLDPHPRQCWLCAVYVLVILVFLGSVMQFYRTDTGFTYLISFGEQFEHRVLTSIRNVPRYVHSGDDASGYDGQFYAQLAVDPLLRDYDLRTALDSAPYRSRRILFSWTAFLLGFGQPAWILQAFALQNVLCWVLVAWLLTRWLPPSDPKYLAAWFACLFSYGMVISVRNSLLEGPSMLLISASLLTLERGRVYLATGLLGIAGLARETNLLAASMFARFPKQHTKPTIHLAVTAVLVALPLVLWFFYIRSEYGPRVATAENNLAWPLVDYASAWSKTVNELRIDGWTSPAFHALLALVSLTVQAGYLIWRAEWNSAWWRIGISYLALMVCLGQNVWAGYPGAATRVLLPMTFAFNLLLPKNRWFWSLVVVGNLNIVTALHELRFF